MSAKTNDNNSSTALAGEVAGAKRRSEGAAQASMLCRVFLASQTLRTPSAFAALQHLPRFAVEESV